ncbi:Periplasmic serine endoprotease DegP precursor [Stieleria maiorica]|uniref:Periplasmic serine endoprotease DegP n=1 Tax=Stieleria maiorica TaxID=2795974 RepID=A0A5B9MDK3_9BACT|nr:PDZ domain-containing protein [Stieleria maiorica]QEF97565.1 Periplasmic serine endoprotease DegP precursor [Stieleria maiorica]
MRSLHLPLSITVLVASATFFAGDASGQGLLQRLRSRIAPLVQNQLEQRDDEASDNELPARPLPARPLARGAARRDAAAQDSADRNAPANNATDSTGPTARYRSLARPAVGGVSRIPSIAPPNPGPNTPNTAPTPAIGPGGVRQAGADALPEPEAAPALPGPSESFGKSILSPLDFGDSIDRQPPSRVAAASIGIKGVSANPGYPAVQITEFANHARANHEGLRVGDFIFAIDGVPTPSVAALVGEVGKHSPGDSVRLRIGRGGQVSDLDITLVAQPGKGAAEPSDRPAYPPVAATVRPQPLSPTETAGAAPATSTGTAPKMAAEPKIGAEVRDVRGRRGVHVTQVQPGSPADAAGLKTEDRIVAINGKMVSDTAGLYALLATVPADSPAELQLIRDNRLATATLSLQSDDSPETATPANGNAGGSLVGGLGSVLGGMFGQSNASSPTPAESKAATADNPQAEPAAEAVLPPPSAPSPPPTVADDSDDVKAEIQRLRDQLKKLESKLDD